MKRNLLALALVAIVCALAAQFLRQSGQSKEWMALRVDMVDALERLWNTRGHQVELLPDGKGVNVSAQVVLPPDCSPRQQQWNYPLLHYVAQHNGAPLLHGLVLHSSLGSLQEMPSPGIATGGALEARLELVRRQAQAWLDGRIGPGNALALVDGESESHFVRAREEGRSKREVAQPFQAEYSTVLVLVINGRAAGAEAKLSRLPELEQALRLQLGERDSRRVVVLP